MNYPKVAIIILNWNGYSDTAECLKSLKKIDYPNYEIVIVDNGSKDGSPDRLKREFPYITLLKNPDNLGFAEGCNVGMRYALERGVDYILLLNNDTVVEQQFLTRMVEAAERDSNTGILCPKIYYYDKPNVIWTAGGKINKLTSRTYAMGLNKADKGQYDKLKEVDYVSGCALLIKAETVEKIGMLDKDYFNHYEDVDWCMRARRRGYKILYIPDSVIYHKVSMALGGKYSPIHMYYQMRNWLWFAKKNGAGILFVPCFIFVFVRRIIYLLVKLDLKGIYANFLGVFDYLKGVRGKCSSNL
ncbi:hypothetical protein AMJ44_02350 [candidate division WOR-1 bacterium DG_54_3]|uniref:Glycosyltransferase 2-like domain-containing protein n=1 Tax=candidate division WOR-1 bacterium DG_54_3 TaxID=1703775 RepID=A0A0S7Y5V1_UNCSA|nr:MAG: hypothetical protein AMJ44_02350 [candidate division WOR-1 bacterium DG_54_3]